MFFNELKIIKTDNQKYRMIEQARSFTMLSIASVAIRSSQSSYYLFFCSSRPN